MAERLNLQWSRKIDHYLGIPLCSLLAHLNKLKKTSLKESKQPKHILLMKFWGFGNLIFLSPTIKALKKRYPLAEIDFLTINEISGLLSSYKEITNIFKLDIQTIPRFLISAVKNLILLRAKKYDIIFDFEQFARNSAILSKLIDSEEIIGFDIPQHGKTELFTKKVPYDDKKHVVESFYDLALAVGCPKQKLKLSKIGYGALEEEKIKVFLNNHKEKGPLIGIHVGSGPNAPGKQWPVKNFAKLADYLIQKFKARVVFTGKKDEETLIQKTMSLMSYPAKNAAGRFDLIELACLLDKCSLFIAGDTGPLHMAVAMNTPTISFYGLCSPKTYGPYGPKEQNKVFYKNLHCSPCITNFNAKLTQCKDIQCIKKITFREVRKAADLILKKK